jgi:gliding motility-associated-like protein
VNPNPTVIATSSSSAICVGETATLTATGANTYSWSSGSINATEIISPSASSVYTVVGTDVLGCINSATVSLIVNSLPVITINPASTVVCSGSSVTYTVSGADTYTWSTNETTSIINVIANTPSGYTVTGTDALGCVNTGTVSLSVNTLPILSLTASPSSVCAGNSSTLTASGANTYIWNTGSSSASLIDNPTITTIYTVTGTDVNGCVSTETINLTVNALPTLTVTKSSNAVCVGHSATLTAVGANTYSWSTGAITASEVVTPTVTTIYTVTGTDAIGCSSSDTVKIIANLLPNLLTNVNTNTICLGGIVVFSNSGANTFTLSPSSLTGSVISVPINTLGVTIYTVSGTGPLGCLNTKTVSITANALPNVSITPTSATICSGQSVTLNAIGANTYTWSGTGTISNSITVSPSSNTTYSLLGTDINGCENSASSIVNVSNTPTISVSSASTNICMGYTMTMTANGASAYNWSTGATTNTINVQPFFNTTYSVVGTNGGLCSDTAIVSLTVLPLPSVTATANTTLACSGQTINLTASGNAVTYYWQPGGLLGANQNLQITSPTTYTAYGQGTNGCVFFNTLFVDVQNGTAVIPVSTPSIVCVGDSAVLSVIGGSVPSWTLNSVPNTAIVTPTVNTSYTVNAVDFNGCASDIVFTVDINADCDVVVYNGFTPNGDGINDFWIIDNIERYPNNKVYVFNRWGNKLFNTVNYNNVDNKWDGKVNGQAVSAGTYFYILVDDTEKLLKKGWIEITN